MNKLRYAIIVLMSLTLMAMPVFAEQSQPSHKTSSPRRCPSNIWTGYYTKSGSRIVSPPGDHLDYNLVCPGAEGLMIKEHRVGMVYSSLCCEKMVNQPYCSDIMKQLKVGDNLTPEAVKCLQSYSKSCEVGKHEAVSTECKLLEVDQTDVGEIKTIAAWNPRTGQEAQHSLSTVWRSLNTGLIFDMLCLSESDILSGKYDFIYDNEMAKCIEDINSIPMGPLAPKLAYCLRSLDTVQSRKGPIFNQQCKIQKVVECSKNDDDICAAVVLP